MATLIIDRSMKDAQAVRSNKLFGQAVFIECGVHDPANFCYDHHSMGETQWQLSSAGMIQQELLQRRRMPQTVVMNHARHLDNLVALYLLANRGLVTHPDTTQLVSAAELIDRIGSLAARSIPQVIHGVLLTAQANIPFKEWELSDTDLQIAAIKAIESLRGMVTAPMETAKITTVWESSDQKFVIAESAQFIGGALYDAGFDAYAVFTRNADGSFKWTLARASVYVPFDIPSAVAELNILEKGWGGRDIIAGSPKETGSRFEIDAVVEVLKKHYTA